MNKLIALLVFLAVAAAASVCLASLLHYGLRMLFSGRYAFSDCVMIALAVVISASLLFDSSTPALMALGMALWSGIALMVASVLFQLNLTMQSLPLVVAGVFLVLLLVLTAAAQSKATPTPPPPPDPFGPGVDDPDLEYLKKKGIHFQ